MAALPPTAIHDAVAAGRHWCEKFPTSKTTAGLRQPFRRAVQAFISELERRGCAVQVNATARPRQRAWLMRCAWEIAREGRDPGSISTSYGLAIRWTHAGAAEMVEVYGLVYRPSLSSRHIPESGETTARAIDMTITGWPGPEAELDALGRSYGVHPLKGDRPHWSDDGR